MVTKGESGGRDKLGVWDQHMHTTICKIDNQYKDILYRKLYSVLCNNL